MTSQPWAKLHRKGGPFLHRKGGFAPGRAFTLAELLVVIGIIALLSAILLPVLIRASRAATATKLAADLQAIASALEAYRGDFQDYPRLGEAYNAAGVYQRKTTNDSGKSRAHERSSILLAWALIGPYEGATGTAGKFNIDGANGLGFRIRPPTAGADGLMGTTDDVYQGKVFGPYLQLDRFKLRDAVGLPNPENTYGYKELIDSYGNPVLYLAAKPGGRADVTTKDPTPVTIQPEYPKTTPQTLSIRYGYLGNGVPAGGARADRALYNFEDAHNYQLNTDPALSSVPAGSGLTATDLRNLAQYRMEKGGDFTGPYILWSAGPDGFFFNADDVTSMNK